MVTKVGRWDCPYCKTKGNPGYEYECSGCEHPRPLGIKFYLPEDAPIATPEQKTKMGNDPNWYCEYCESGNQTSVERCWKCGAPRSSKSVVHSKRVYYDSNIPRSAEEAEAMEVTTTAEPVKPYIPRDDPYNPPVSSSSQSYESVMPDDFSEGNKKSWLKIGGIAVGVLALFVLIYCLFFRTVESTAVVQGFSWSQNVAIEEYQTFHEEGWSVPAGGRMTGSTIRQSGTVKVTDGYHYETVSDTCYRPVTVSRTCTSDDGNGGFTEYDCSYSSEESYSCTKQEQVEDYHYDPVYSTWYFYDIDRWTVIGNYPTSGNDHQPYFDPAQPVGDLQRRIEQQGTYTVFFTSDAVEPFERTYDIDTWLTFELGQSHKIKVNALKMVISIE